MCHLPRARLMYGLDTRRVSLPKILPSVENEEDIELAGDLNVSDGSEESISCEEDLVCSLQ